MKKIIFALLICGVAGYGVLNYHFILFDKSFKILKKSDVNYENTFVDARGARKYELVLMPDLLSAGIKDIIVQIDSAQK